MLNMSTAATSKPTSTATASRRSTCPRTSIRSAYRTRYARPCTGLWITARSIPTRFAARRGMVRRKASIRDFLYCGNGAADVLDRLIGGGAETAGYFSPHRPLRSTSARYQVRNSGHNLRETDGLRSRAHFGHFTGFGCGLSLQSNNPTGRTAQPELLREIVRKCTEKRRKTGRG